MAEPEYTRLHITPLSASLLTAILPPSVLPNARNVSYHSVQTFPERAYGYVDLPTMDADKIKKKLNGSILKGTKVRVETARPAKEKLAEEPETPKPKKEKGVKRKRDEVSAVDIGERQVKRGWTVPATLTGKEREKKGVVNKSKYTTAPECLFKTVIPPNVASKGSAKDTKPTKVKGTKGKEAVVHEFAKATKYATFLRSGTGTEKKKAVAEFVKGKGWVDEDGNIVEAVKGGTVAAPRKPGLDGMDIDESESSSDEEVPTRAEKAMASVKAQLKAPVKKDVDSSEDDSSDDSSSADEAQPKPIEKAVPKAKDGLEDSNSDSNSDSSSESEAEEKEQTPALTTPVTKKAPSPPSTDSPSDVDSSTDTSDSDSDEQETPAKASSRPQSSSGGALGLSIKIPPTPTAISTTVHPLEALYKRPKPDTFSTPASKPSAPSFNFFGEDADEEMEDSQPQVPLTPFTQKDFEFRGMRSAAPTPDTAFANKKFIWPTDDDDDDDNDNDEDKEPEAASTSKKGKEVQTEEKGDKVGDETEFQKWFYEHRGEANRAWKKRRKVVAKEKRQRENRKRQERI